MSEVERLRDKAEKCRQLAVVSGDADAHLEIIPAEVGLKQNPLN
jgi:hypothetical protein